MEKWAECWCYWYRVKSRWEAVGMGVRICYRAVLQANSENLQIWWRKDIRSIAD